jgi:Cu(I)/Ag(I) efflux system membrane fusion protein
MRNLLLLVAVFTLGGFLGLRFGPEINNLAGLGFMSNTSMPNGTASDEKKPLYWVAPMDKNYRRDGPGQSPMGMDLVPVYEDGSGGSDSSVKISSAVENNLGVRVAPVLKEKLVLPVKTVGTVQFDESRIQHVHSRVEGWIESLGVSASGDPVSKGQILYEIYSPALVSAQEEYLAAVRSGNKNLINASSGRLYALGLTPTQAKKLARRGKVEQRISVVAEQDGVVIDLNVRKGMYIKPSTEVLSIGSLDSVWIIGEVFERQAYLVKQGQDVNVELNAMPGKSWSGSINYIYPKLDPKTRTLNVRVRVLNADHVLKPNMLANLTVIGSASEETLTIPQQALIKAGHHNRVVKALGDGRYKSVLVSIGSEGLSDQDGTVGAVKESRVQVLSGLSEGDSVVTSAQFLIDSESNIDAELMRMEEGDSSMSDAEQNSMSLTKVRATGTVTKVMQDMQMLSINHDPIPEWDWPSMKMDFQVAPGLALDQITQGQSIRFELEKTGDWDYVVTELVTDSVDGATDTSAGLAPEQDSDSGAVRTTGKIKMMMLDMNMLEVVHEPIPEWDWPQMSMSFVVAKDETLPTLKEGDEITFDLKELEGGDYEMSKVTLK